MRNFIAIAILIFTITISSCRKDKTAEPCSELTTDYHLAPITDRNYTYVFPCFNPNNSNEFVCKRSDVNDQGTLVIYDLQSQNMRTVKDSLAVWNAPKWSISNKIVFGGGGILYKIDPDGNNLAQLTFANSNHPAWNYNGEKIVYYSSERDQAIKIIDENGNLIKEIDTMAFTSADWSVNNGFIATAIDNHLNIIDDSTFEVQNIVLDAPIGLGISDVCWLDSVNLIYAIDGSIYRMNVISQTKQLIKAGCSSKFYRKISIANDKQRMLVHAAEYAVNHAEKTFFVYFEIYLMNIDGSNETKVELPKF